MPVATATPGRTLPVSATRAWNRPRSLKTSAHWPSLKPRVCGVLGRQLDRRIAGGGAMAGRVGERRVEELGPRRAEELQRIPRRQVGARLRVLVRRDVGRQRVQAVGLHPLGVELALARRRGEDAVGKRGETLGDVEPDRALRP